MNVQQDIIEGIETKTQFQRFIYLKKMRSKRIHKNDSQSAMSRAARYKGSIGNSGWME